MDILPMRALSNPFHVLPNVPNPNVPYPNVPYPNIPDPNIPDPDILDPNIKNQTATPNSLPSSIRAARLLALNPDLAAHCHPI
ncbi:hypothetical protein METBIDRAFT_33410 [Metschnikowia bicuspidata var. bicuspidata NRRL YB-4993]|uniref:Uncharacterized protein n=1 Tax=Metschnikowia bicuspidata var. bicuspidata NRRL YB-4993 TaxID=869754 RepID=A0A1A0H5H8_9ASCO|nr:hypothetical protein METBIDRAFT_33410 [Metschnikowia bicuspidata var. bicuspidata NRRL YB-4993]OBA19200.1 hypothetical protein METBIDRAFT_33410 [Metschnikowia bicuspidata var. bicuspidata NRRL YB-4993]